MTTKQVAAMTKLKQRTIARYCQTGLITATKEGRDWSILKKDAVAFAKNRRPPGNPNWSSVVID